MRFYSQLILTTLLTPLFVGVALSETMGNILPLGQKDITSIQLSQDTSKRPLSNSITSADKKVIMSTGENTFELSPQSNFNNGAVIQPINNTTNAGISTAFYLKDNSNWSFFTDSKLRLTINGDGGIVATSPLLINNAIADGVSQLRINGISRFDSAISIQAVSDTNSFISLHRNIDMVNGTDDSVSPYTTTPTAWALGHNLPGLRIRHPNNVSGKIWNNESIERDFLIVPYVAGMAIEYNGVVECWVGEWSIHKGVYYNDVEGKGNGWGAVLWVGDDVDRGGVRATARNNTTLGGTVEYGELSVEKFWGESNGDFRFRLPSTTNQFHFVYGERGSQNIVAKLSSQGFIIPIVSSSVQTSTPEKAQILFDSTDNKFKGYNGKDWVSLENNALLSGKHILSGDGINKEFVIPHGLNSLPSFFNVIATASQSANISYITADANYIYIHYSVAPPAGINNLSWNWQIKN